MNNYLATATLLAFFANGMAHAEPSRSVIYLMNEPLTLWDYGIYRASESLSDLTLLPSRTKYFATMFYRPESNQLTIFTRPPLDLKNKTYVKPKSVREAKALCKDMIDGVRVIFAVDPVKGTSINPYSNNSALCNYFSHDGFKSSNEPGNLCSELDSMTVVRAYAETIDAVTIRCEGSLLSNSVLFSQ